MTEQISLEEAMDGVVEYMNENNDIEVNSKSERDIDFYLSTSEELKEGIVSNLQEHGWKIHSVELAVNPETDEEKFHIKMESPEDPILAASAAEIFSEYLD